MLDLFTNTIHFLAVMFDLLLKDILLEKAENLLPSILLYITFICDDVFHRE